MINESPFEEASQLALKFFSRNAKEKKELTSLLAQYGITTGELHAKAVQLESGGLQMLDRLVAARESSRRMLRKEALHRDHDPNETEQ
jgi:hypothetical protein